MVCVDFSGFCEIVGHAIIFIASGTKLAEIANMSAYPYKLPNKSIKIFYFDGLIL